MQHFYRILNRRNFISRGWLLLHNFIESTYLKIEPSALSRARRVGRYIKDHSETIYLLFSQRGAYKSQPFAPTSFVLFFSAYSGEYVFHSIQSAETLARGPERIARVFAVGAEDVEY